MWQHWMHLLSFMSTCHVTGILITFCRQFAMSARKKLILFDVDGTLTEPRKRIADSMKDFLLNDICSKAEVALVGGSDLKKISEQMGGSDVLSKIPYVFSENGLVGQKYGVEFFRKSIQDHMGEEALQKFINFSLAYMSKLVLPVKRGTFIEFRTGLINVSPVGRGCSQAERDQFEEYDKANKVREKFIEELRKEFPNLGLVYSIGGEPWQEDSKVEVCDSQSTSLLVDEFDLVLLNNEIKAIYRELDGVENISSGGQISFDVFPIGWDKTYCLNHIKPEEYEEVHFFGDKTDKGGNDYEIYNSSKVIGHKVTSPNDTMSQLKSLLNL